MKQSIIIKAFFVAAFGLLSVGAMAQGQQQGPANQQEMEAQQIERLTKHLSLTAEQVARIQEVNHNSREAVMALRNDQTMDRQVKMEKMRSMRAEREAAIKAILTQEQAQKYEAMLQNQQNQQGQQGQRPQGRRRGAN